MNPSAPLSSDENITTPGVSRRAVSTAAAWTVPVVALAVSTPAAAASADKVGYVLVDPLVDFVRPGDTYPLITITLHQPAPDNSVVNTTNATVTVILPPGYTWADGTPVTATGRVFPNVAGGTLLLKDYQNGTNWGVVAAQDPFGVQKGGTISASAVDPSPGVNDPISYTPGNAELKTDYNTIPGTGGSAGSMWADNTGFRGFALEGYDQSSQSNPIPFATPMDVVGSFAGHIVDVTAAGALGGFLVENVSTSTVPATRVWEVSPNQTAMTTGIVQNKAIEVLIPAGRLRTGEYVVQVSAGLEVLTNFGRVFSFASPSGIQDEFPEYTFPVAAGAAQPFVKQVVGTRYNASGVPCPIWSVARTADGSVWSLSKLGAAINDSSYAGDGATHANLSTPVQVLAGTLTDVVEVSAGVMAGMARTASGQVYTWGNNQSGFNAGGNGLVAGLPPIVKLGQTSNTQTGNFGTVSVVAADGSLYSWGANYYGQNNTSAASLNNSTSGVTHNTTMDAQRGSRKIVDVANVGPSTAVILDDNSVWSWGSATGLGTGSGGYLGAGANGQYGNGLGPADVTLTPLRVVHGKAGDPYPYPDHFATKFFDSNYQTYATDTV